MEPNIADRSNLSEANIDGSIRFLYGRGTIKVLHLLFYALCSAFLVRASEVAGIFETLYYYYGYRIEASAFAEEDDRMIASTCKPAEGKFCTFNEFIKNIGKTPGELIAAGDTILPVVEDADVTFKDMSWKGTYFIDKLYKGGKAMNHVEMMAAVTNRIQAARQAMTVDSDLLAGAKQGLALTQVARWQDNFSKVPESFNARYEDVTLYDTETTVDGVKINVIDWVKTATVEANKTGSKAKTLLGRYQKWANSAKNGEYHHHQSMLRNIAAFRNVLEAVPTCRATIVRYKKSP